MHEETRLEQNIEKFRSIEEAFEEKLGIPFPEKPEDLPSEILLKPSVFGGLIEAVLAQETEDKLYGDGSARERSQFVGNLSRDGSLKDTSVLIGSKKLANDALEEIKKWLRPLIGLTSKPLTFWHTHTAEQTALPNEGDVAIRIGEDRKCIIYLHASPSEITAIIQTRKAYPRFLPFSTVQKGVAALGKIEKLYNSYNREAKFEILTEFLEEHGYALYTWKKPNQVSTVKEGVDAGCFISGIKMQKV